MSTVGGGAGRVHTGVTYCKTTCRFNELGEKGVAEPNFANRTIWTGDNLDILRGLNSECVDLIYLDPPFNSNQDYSAPVGSKAAGAAFKDTWTLSDLDVAWMGIIADKQPAMYQVLQTAGLTHGKGMQSYLCMMGIRLLEMRRVLKTTGSIYLHCDPTASHYLKLLMDAIFGRQSFRSEVTWRRVNSTGRGRRRYPNNADTLLYYTRSEEFHWNRPYKPHTPEYVTKFYRHIESNTGRRYRLDNLKGAGTRTGDSGAPWRGVDPNDTGSHWAVPGFALPDGARSWSTQKKLDYLEQIGRIYWPPKGSVPAYKRYLDEMPGTPVDTIWDDIRGIQAQSAERTGYPTQKPLALLDRIIKASSNEGDMVLDPFCGCATACVSAEELGRQWVGIDLSPKAVELVNLRLKEFMGELFHSQLVTARTDIPRRTDIEKPINYRRNKHVLFGRQEGQCNGCRMEFPFKMFDVDHVIPRSRGGTDHLDNLQLLCSHCNRLKGNRTQEYLLVRLAGQ